MRALPFLGIASALGVAGCDYIPGSEANLTSRARPILEKSLLDPESATFRNVRRGHSDESGNDIICGELNVRNRFGGYTGYKRFMVFLNEDRGFVEPGVNLNTGEGSLDERQLQAVFDVGFPAACERP